MIEHSIPLLPNTVPIRRAPRRLGREREAEVQKQVNGLFAKNLIEPADSNWSSHVVLVKKKDGSWHFCVDNRHLNVATRQDAYPLPRIDESLDALAGSRFFSTLNLTSGYWQVPLDSEAQDLLLSPEEGTPFWTYLCASDFLSYGEDLSWFALKDTAALPG